MFEWIKTESGFERVERYGFNSETIIPTGDFLTYGDDARDVWRFHTVVDGVEYVAPIDASRGSLLEQAKEHTRLLNMGWRPETWNEYVKRVEDGRAYRVIVANTGENNAEPLYTATFRSELGARKCFEARAAEIGANIYWADGAEVWAFDGDGDEIASMDMYRAEG